MKLSTRGRYAVMAMADLARYAGLRVEVAHGLAGKTFSGTLVIGDGQRALQDLAQLMDVRLSGGAGTYRLDGQR